MKCIYCLEDRDSQYFLKTEHVMPQSFGLFKNNFTLNGTNHPHIVCDCCNQYFGDNLEIDLARDAFESVYRYEYGIKEPEKFKSLGKRSRRKIIIAEGEFKGAYAYLEYSESQEKIVLKPIPQIGFRKKDSSEYEFFLLDAVPEKTILEQREFDLDHPQGIMMLDQDRSRLKKVLAARGITNIKFGGEIEPVEPNQDWLCKVEREIDNTIRRTVAKIAFNYLAFWEGREFVLHEDFDVVRRFIRNDETPPYPLVLIDDKSILQDEHGNKRRVGHLITLEYAADGKSILSQVSILNLFTYKVCLAREFSGLLKDIRKGHFFNIKNMEIWELGAIPALLRFSAT